MKIFILDLSVIFSTLLVSLGFTIYAIWLLFRICKQFLNKPFIRILKKQRKNSKDFKNQHNMNIWTYIYSSPLRVHPNLQKEIRLKSRLIIMGFASVLFALIITALPGKIDGARFFLIATLFSLFCWQLVSYFKYLKTLIQDVLLPEYASLFKSYRGQIDLKSFLILYLQRIRVIQSATPDIIKCLIAVLVPCLLSVIGPMALQ